MQCATMLLLLVLCVQLVYVYAQDCIQNEEFAPKCEIVDILRLMDDEEAPSFECLEDYPNSIHLRHGGEISLECWAPYAIDVKYDSVLPANHFDLSFYKKIETHPDRKSYNLNSLNTTFYTTIFMHGTHIPWAANYIIYDVNKKSRQTTVFVFIEKTFPLFLSQKDENDEEISHAYYDEEKEHVILPCRVQNWNSAVELFSPDFEELTDGSFDDILKFDPRTGFTIKWDAARLETGQYRCMTKRGEENDEMKVIVVSPDDYHEPEQHPPQNVEGTITFKMAGDNHVAECRAGRLPPKVFGLANVRSKNPTTTQFTMGCLDSHVTCDNRKTGASTDSGTWEINPIYRSGLLRCSNKQTIEYFLGSNDQIYRTLEAAKLKNALVDVYPADKNTHYYIPNQKYEMSCKMASYHVVKPIFWSVHFKNETQTQHFAAKETMEFVMTSDVIGITCGTSLWNSDQWYTSYLPIKAAETSAPDITADVTHFEFELGSINRVIRCKARGFPFPTLTWLRNGKEVDAKRTLKSVDDPNELLLMFPHQITNADEGEYTCRASNSLGETDVVFTVEVHTVEILAPPAPLHDCKNTTTTISTTKIITFFQFQPATSDGQLTVPSRDQIRPGDQLQLFIPNVNSARPELMPMGMNLTVRVISMESSDEEIPVPDALTDDNSVRLAPLGRMTIVLAIIITCIALVLIVACWKIYCFSSR